MGQSEETASRSVASSTFQPLLAAGSGALAPCSLTFRKQPLVTVQGTRPVSARKVARSDAAFG